MAPKDVFSGIEARTALASIVTACQEAAELGRRLEALADRITATIDVLAPATGTTVGEVFAAFQDGETPRAQG
jgi:RNA processing factor Prp31